MGHSTSIERNALSAIDREGLVETVRELVRIPSVGGTPAESEAQRAFASHMERAGLEVDLWAIDLDQLRADPEFPGMEVPRDEALGVVGRWGREDGPTLVINGHVDVVPTGDLADWTIDPFDSKIIDGTITGRGSCDMKGGLVCGLAAIRAIREAGISLRGSVLLESVVGEEDGGLGTFATLRRGYRGDAAIIPEPTDLAIVPVCAGALTFRITIQGRSAHASVRKRGVDAVEKLWPIMRSLKELEVRKNVDAHPLMARYDPAYPISLGIVRAGDWASSVPDRLVAEGRLGVALGESPAQARLDLESALLDACQADDWLRDHPVELEWIGGQFASGSISEDHRLTELIRQVHRDLRGAEPDMHGVPFGSDLRLMTNVGGVPTIHYGPGRIEIAHAPDEHVDIKQLFQAVEAYVLAILRFCKTD